MAAVARKKVTTKKQVATTSAKPALAKSAPAATKKTASHASSRSLARARNDGNVGRVVLVKVIKDAPKTASAKPKVTAKVAGAAKLATQPIKANKVSSQEAPVPKLKTAKSKPAVSARPSVNQKKSKAAPDLIAPNKTKKRGAEASKSKAKVASVRSAVPAKAAEVTVSVTAKPTRKTKRRRQTKRAAQTKVVSKANDTSKQSPTAVRGGKKPSQNHKTSGTAKSIELVPKAKRVRVPKDFAQQYGGAEKQKKVVETSETKRARRDAALRQKMRDAMEVGDDLVARLRRAGMIGGGDEPESKNGHGAPRFSGKMVRRPRKWEARCGKCGSKSLFKSQAGLCLKCGAIMVRD